MAELTVQSTSAEDTTLLTLSGELDIAAKEPLGDAVSAALEDHPPSLVIDLTPTTFVDSTGLSYLLAARRRADDAQTRLAIRAPPGSEARVVIDLAGVGSLLNLEDPAPRSQPPGA
jgi:anti-anti-sigma factor